MTKRRNNTYDHYDLWYSLGIPWVVKLGMISLHHMNNFHSSEPECLAGTYYSQLGDESNLILSPPTIPYDIVNISPNTPVITCVKWPVIHIYYLGPTNKISMQFWKCNFQPWLLVGIFRSSYNNHFRWISRDHIPFTSQHSLKKWLGVVRLQDITLAHIDL